MITFTPLSGGATSSHATPLCYLLQVDDIRILLDCGCPDWNYETDFIGDGDADMPWRSYTNLLKR